MSQHSAKTFAHNSISAREFCKDLQKFDCFGTFGSKWTCLFIKTLKKSKI